ncbi:MAG: 4-alpha-glucanotransferase [Clostridia bacterium]|nr:4-alpha-glucanotransferase [Clostridia bacterium]
MTNKKAGILLPIFSLPSKYGIGSLGKSAFAFVDFLKECNQQYWQVLPLNPTIFGDSPYQSPSAFAGNHYFIDIDTLVEDGLLDKSYVKGYQRKSPRIDYGYLFESRLFLLKKAFELFDINQIDYLEFKQDNAFWLDDYALFMSIKEYHNNSSWSSWGKEEKYRINIKKLQNKYAGSIEFWKFAQYEFYSQYAKVKSYANLKGIEIVGDMPIYVAYDSVDVWSKPKNYLLDQDLNPTVVAGVPPDAFSADGQLWGNPIYNWQKMKRDKFAWWIDRLSIAYKLYDVIRIDHFRGFEAYYVVDKDCDTAKIGEWRKGVGISLFKELDRHIPHAKIIAEDLGVITPPVRQLLKKTGYPGMKVLQFAFGDEDSDYLPKNIKSSNCVVYTGTHDNMTTPQWFGGLDQREKTLYRKSCKPKKGENDTHCLIRAAMSTKAERVIIPMADYLGLKAEGRINAPSTTGDNWTWRLKDKYDTPKLREKIKELTAYRTSF